MDYDVYALAILVIICSLAVAVLDKLGKKKHVIVVSIVICLFSLATIVKQCNADDTKTYLEKKEKKNQKKLDSINSALTDTINNKIETVKLFQKKLTDSTNRILKTQSSFIEDLKNSVDAQNKLVKAQRETIKGIMGDGFPIVHIKQRNNSIYYTLLVNSDPLHAIFDLHLTAIDFENLHPENFRNERGIYYYSKDSITKYSKDLPEISLGLNSSSLLDY